MNKKLVYWWIWLFLLGIVLFSFSQEFWENIEEKIGKKDYIIETQKVWEFDSELIINKIWKLSSNQDIELFSDSSWKIEKIFFKQWDYIKKWEQVAIIDDNISNFWINLQKVKNQLNDAKLEYKSQKIDLDKNIFDSLKYLEELKDKLNNSKKIKQNNIKKIENNLSDLNVDELNSKSSLDLKRIDNQISKLNLDLENKIVSDSEQIHSLEKILKSNYKSFQIIYNDVLDFWDRIFDITGLHKNKNDKFEDYLWAKKISIKKEVINKLKKLNNNKNNFYINDKINNENIIEYSDKLSKSIEELNNVLGDMEQTFYYSIESAWSLSSTDIKYYLTQIDIYQSSLDSFRSSFISEELNTKSFLRTYEQNQESLTKEVNLLKKDKEILLKSFWSDTKNTKLNLDSIVLDSDSEIVRLEREIEKAEYNYNYLLNSKEIILSKLNNNIEANKISLQEANKEYSKLFIKSPISWEITDVYIDVWDNVSNWSKILHIVWEKEKQIKISFNENEITKITKWQLVKVIDMWVTYEWYIDSVSKIADKNLNYNATIKLKENINSLWKLLEVYISYQNNALVLPIKNIEILSESGSAIIKTMSWSKIIEKTVLIGQILWDKIEILSELDENVEIIISNVDEFDKSKFNLKIKK